MSDQGPIPDRRADDFGLIETLLWTRAGGFDLLPEHLARLAASSAALGFRYDEAKVCAALASATSAVTPIIPPPCGEGLDGPKIRESESLQESEQRVALPERLRVRLVLWRDGAIETSATPIDPVPPETIWRVAIAARRFSSSDPLLRHKTTRRALYEDTLAEAMKTRGAEEVLFLNERDELCEGARCTLFVPQGDVLLTPPLSCGLLPGTLRAKLIAAGRAREAILRLQELARDFYLGNSVRGLVRARLID